MFTEDYVSFEIAKLLNEKGFNEPCFVYYNLYYDNNGKDLKLWQKFPHRNQPNDDYLNVPTLQTTMKWLREVHGVNINNELTIHGYFCSISHIVKDSFGNIIDIEDSGDWETAYYNTYEEACEDAIKYCLEYLI